MKKYLILLAGSPGTGKTFLIQQIKRQIPDLFLITPDEGKELFADSVGFNSLEEKAELEKRVWQFYYGVLALYLEAGKRMIVSEYPFSNKQKHKLAEYANRYHYEVITIRLVADFEVLWQRRQQRDLEPERHLSHLMQSYHYGDHLEDRSKADNQITRDEFKAIIEARGYESFRLGELHEFDVTDYRKVEYESLIDYLENKMKRN
ncbi:AAA family ATPase [Carnobacterium gallinarum]|uniref:AAA family ATPase n=1 Tax=Carnobacterium gallinarum TaxID=2749 RepID=UPI000552245D|nr:AAA family ATPase [Carnobacterium gallinarum]